MKITILSLILIWISAQAVADIAPNPIQAKGISTKYPTEIKMTYEKISVTLTLDSSFVHCYFRLHNEGKAEKVQIGYPVMNTSPFTLPDSRYAPLKVHQNGTAIKDINLKLHESKKTTANTNSWYLWDTFLDEGETMEIEVSYSLPHGLVKNNLYYKFDYLLSTGAGWKGKIDTAEIIVTLENFDKNLLLKTAPENYSVIENQLVWKLYDIEPTAKDDISIKYEKRFGQYDEKLKNVSPSIILNEETLLSNDIRLTNNFESLEPKDIVQIRILKNSEETKIKLPDVNRSNGVILIYSKSFIPKRQVENLNSKLNGLKHLKISAIPISEFVDKYSIEINGRKIDKKDIPTEIIKINESSINQVSLKKLNKNKYHISIRTD